MLLEYSAQLKCRTLYHTVKGIKFIGNIPHDIKRLIINIHINTTNVIKDIQNQIKQLKENNSSNIKQRRKYEKTAKYLKNANELLKTMKTKNNHQLQETKT